MLLEYKKIIDEEIVNYFNGLPNNGLHEAMAYSMTLGGKRLRPALVLLTAKIFGGQVEELMPMALAMEMIHTYSLIHDDLPSMDNDDFRRGKPTNHKVFGEANAILAGDALLNEAFSILLRTYAVKGILGAKASLLISECAGREGMIGGQIMDLRHEKVEATYEQLKVCHHKKTGALIAASLAAPAQYLGATTEEVQKLYAFGLHLGLAFQIQDDILDVTSTREVLGKTIGKDREAGKTTYVGLFGIDKSKEMAEEITNECIKVLEELPRDTEELKELTRSLLRRTY